MGTADPLEEPLEHLVPAFRVSDPSYVTSFPAVSSILGTRLDQGSEDFCQPPDLPCLRQLPLDMPSSNLERRARLLPAQLESVDLGEAEPEGEEGGGTRGEQRLASDSPCGDHRRGPRSGASGMGGGMFSTFGRQARGPPAASPHLRMWNRPQQQPWHNPQTSIRAAEAAADGAAPGAGGARQRLDGPEQEHQGCTAAAPGPEETPTPPGPTALPGGQSTREEDPRGVYLQSDSRELAIGVLTDFHSCFVKSRHHGTS
ncbi:hypothetical protein R6Z07F_003641 [Ovis aries]